MYIIEAIVPSIAHLFVGSDRIPDQFNVKQEAVDVLSGALRKHRIEFKTRDVGDTVEFLNKEGVGRLAMISPRPGAGFRSLSN